MDNEMRELLTEIRDLLRAQQPATPPPIDTARQEAADRIESGAVSNSSNDGE